MSRGGVDPIELEPENVAAHRELGAALLRRGDDNEAISALEQATELAGGHPLAQLGYAYAKAGREADARRILEDVDSMPERDNYASAAGLTDLLVALGDLEAAVARVESDFERRDFSISLIRCGLEWGTLRSEPRIRSLMGRIEGSMASRLP